MAAIESDAAYRWPDKKHNLNLHDAAQHMAGEFVTLHECSECGRHGANGSTSMGLITLRPGLAAAAARCRL